MRVLPGYNGLGWFHPRGRFETFSCASCGHAEWYAYELPRPDTDSPASATACSECGTVGTIGIGAWEYIGSGTTAPRWVAHGVGRYDWLICRECGRTRWFARELDELRALKDVERVLERGHGSRPEPFAVLLEPSFWSGSVPRGTFEAFICKGCGYTEWYARDIEFLRDDPANGVHLIVNDPDKVGPYR